MGLFLVESALPRNLREREALEQTVASLADNTQSAESSLIEVQVSSDLTRAFFVLETQAQASVPEILGKTGVPVTLVKAVRLVGADLEQVKNNALAVRYLVEWNLPEGLTMEKYIARKMASPIHYAEVPAVTFQRTYVCEDLTKCVCFYDSPDEETVYEARKAVGASVDAITETFRIPTQK